MYHEEKVPDSARGHLDKAEAAIQRARERISESSILRSKTLSMRVSGTMPAVKSIEREATDENSDRKGDKGSVYPNAGGNWDTGVQQKRRGPY